VTTATIIGAGDIGGAIAHALARREWASRVWLVDGAGNAAAGILHQGKARRAALHRQPVGAAHLIRGQKRQLMGVSADSLSDCLDHSHRRRLHVMRFYANCPTLKHP